MDTRELDRQRRNSLSNDLTDVVGKSVCLVLEDTGGGNGCLRLELNNSRYLMITTNCGTDVPASGERLLVGWYKPNQDEAYYLLEFENDDKFLVFCDWAPRMLISGDPMEARFMLDQSMSWAKALELSAPKVLTYPNASDRFWAPA